MRISHCIRRLYAKQLEGPKHSHNDGAWDRYSHCMVFVRQIRELDWPPYVACITWMFNAVSRVPRRVVRPTTTGCILKL